MHERRRHADVQMKHTNQSSRYSNADNQWRHDSHQDFTPSQTHTYIHKI